MRWRVRPSHGLPGRPVCIMQERPQGQAARVEERGGQHPSHVDNQGRSPRLSARVRREHAEETEEVEVSAKERTQEASRIDGYHR